MDVIDAIANNYANEAKADYVGLWQIASRLKKHAGITADSEIKEKTLLVAQNLMKRNIMPGNLAETGGFIFWQGTPSELLARIEADWPKNGIPRLDYSACWFALKKA